jgi:ribosomal-protein-alanine N-acetyltransferase
MPDEDAHRHTPGTPRLLLRRWRRCDLDPFARINADPQVMEHLVEPLTRERSDALVERTEASFERNGYGLWAVEVRETGELAGFTGLVLQTFAAPFTPAVEVGWRLAVSAWGRGYATEAAAACLDHAFGALSMQEVVSMTSPRNTRSVAVMQRLGMTRDPADDFDHPRVPEGHPLRRAVLYRTSAAAWHRRQGG